MTCVNFTVDRSTLSVRRSVSRNTASNSCKILQTNKTEIKSVLRTIQDSKVPFRRHFSV
jgi:hypothetical protein